MIPIHDLLARIRWDDTFGKANFTIGYVDHVEKRIVRIPLARAVRDAVNPDMLNVTTDDGSIATIPLHRIVEVRRDDEVIWLRRV